jgi:3-isopropylmalate dehydratase small subunit
MEGLDDIGLTLEKADHIKTFETESRARRPWA